MMSQTKVRLATPSLATSTRSSRVRGVVQLVKSRQQPCTCMDRRGLLISSSSAFLLYAAAASDGDVSASAEPLDDQLPSDAEVVPLQTFTPAPAGEPFGDKRALVFGGTGKTGSEIVKQLQGEGVFASVFARSTKKANEMFKSEIEAEGVDVYEGDVSRYEDVTKAVESSGCNIIFIATGTRAALDPLGPFSVDYNGTCNIVAAAKKQGQVKHIVLVTSIGVDDILFPLNLFWGVLFWKKRAEEDLQRSGIKYTIVRPGGLLDEPRSGTSASAMAIRMGGPDAYGLPPRKTPGSILRSQVAEVCVQSLIQEDAFNKTVEIVTEEGDVIPLAEQFGSV